MKRTGKSNTAASVRARLTNVAEATGEPIQHLLQRYVNQRLLYRLSQGAHADGFILKGATLFALWMGTPHRATKDIDFLARRIRDEEQLRETFAEILGAELPFDDGVSFDVKKLAVARIREEQRYGGLRVTTTALLGSARLPVQIDVGFGDAADSEKIVVPSLLGFPSPELSVYKRTAVVAEKLEAMVQLGELNSRMKDFYDLHALSEHFDFEGEPLVRAVRSTFERRRTPIPAEGLQPLAALLKSLPDKSRQWAGFVRKARVEEELSFADAVDRTERFLDEPLRAALNQSAFTLTWPAKGPCS